MTERYRSFCGTYSFSHGIAIPLPHLENVFHGYLMWITLSQCHKVIHNPYVIQLQCYAFQKNKITVCLSFFFQMSGQPILTDIMCETTGGAAHSASLYTVKRVCIMQLISFRGENLHLAHFFATRTMWVLLYICQMPATAPQLMQDTVIDRFYSGTLSLTDHSERVGELCTMICRNSAKEQVQSADSMNILHSIVVAISVLISTGRISVLYSLRAGPVAPLHDL